MAYHARVHGLGAYRLAKTRNEEGCFICLDRILPGNLRYTKANLSLCTSCAHCWQEEGGKLGAISRSKHLEMKKQ